MGIERFGPSRAIAFLIAAAVAIPSAFGRTASRTLDEARVRELKPVWDGALLFRQMALEDHRKALAACASESARELFRTLDQDVWGEIDPVVGWSFFMNASVLVVAATEGPRPVIGYYHPYSDVFLLTSWELARGDAFLADADVFMGDWVRSRASPPFETLPLWRRGGTFVPAALGRAVADSVRSLEEVFRGWKGADWRARLGSPPKDASAAEINRPGAAVMLTRSLRTVDRFALPRDDEPEMLNALRTELAFTLLRIRESGVAKVLDSADMTLPSMRSLLREVPSDAFQGLVVIATVIGSKDAVAIMAPTYDADLCLSFYFTGTPDRLRLGRVDIVYYAGWYKASADAGLAPGAGR